MENNFYIPLMSSNIERDDINCVINFLSQDPIPKLTNGPKVIEFEEAWSKWLGVKYSIFVNSGTAANQLTMLAISCLAGSKIKKEVIVPPLTWVSDIASVLQAGFTPVFVDINLETLSFDAEKLKKAINPNTRAIFLTHVLGLNGLTNEIIKICDQNDILLVEDVCESHGATFRDRKLGSFGFASNFSFYFAHHISTIEGGMVCTNDPVFYQLLRCLRSHGMLRESTDDHIKKETLKSVPHLNPDFVFIAPAYNFRSTEINAVLGLNQLTKLDANNKKRQDNFEYFINKLNKDRFVTDLNIEGQCNYAFIVILKDADFDKRNNLEKELNQHGIEFRRGLSGGGNQTLQPYLSEKISINQDDFPNINHIHNFSWYIGNYPTLEKEKIDTLLYILNYAKI